MAGPAHEIVRIKRDLDLIYIFIYLFIYLFIYIYIYIFIYLLICMYIVHREQNDVQ